MRAAAVAMLLLVASEIHAARAANAYPKTFYWRGESAVRIARLFGIDPSRAATVRLRESYELYRLDPTHHDDWLTDGPKSRLVAPPVYATIRFTPGADARLTLEGVFFDGMTSIYIWEGKRERGSEA